MSQGLGRGLSQPKDDLAKEVEELALEMDEAEKAKLDADAKENGKKATVAAGQAAADSAALADDLRSKGLGDDADEVARISKVAEDASHGNAKPEELVRRQWTTQRGQKCSTHTSLLGTAGYV